MPSNGACLAAASAPDLTPAIAPEAFHGIAGRVVSAIDPITEADPVATLVTFLVSVGNMLGADVHAMAGEDPHPPRLYAALVGQSSHPQWGRPRLERQPDHVGIVVRRRRDLPRPRCP